MPHWSIFFCKSVKSSFGTGPSSSSTFELNLRWVKDLTGLAFSLITSKKEMIEKLELDLYLQIERDLGNSVPLICCVNTVLEAQNCHVTPTKTHGNLAHHKLERSFPDTVSLSIVIHIWKMTFKKIVFLLFDIMMGLTVISSQFDDFTLTWFLVGRLRHIYW